jgi:3-hydroxymyristoyl/3-hydroxydecanoyl-(acyl carrier protein) dehydratase
MIDAILEYRPGFLRAIKRITANDGCFERNPEAAGELPNVLLLEMMAQAAAALGRLDQPGEKGTILVPGMIAAIRRARFYRKVGAGDTAIISAELIQRVSQLSKVRARVFKDEKKAAWADLILVLPERKAQKPCVAGKVE